MYEVPHARSNRNISEVDNSEMRDSRDETMRGAFVILLLVLLMNLLQCLLDDPQAKQTSNANKSRNVYDSSNLNESTIPKRKNKNLVALIFSNKTIVKNNQEIGATLTACKWLKGHKKQMLQCLNRRGFAKVLQDAKKLAVTHCQDQFSFDRWDCTNLQNSMFKKIYRETAFMQAITASALMYSVAKACSDGKLQSCYCMERPKRANSRWHGVGCADNTRTARKITRRFLMETNDKPKKQIGLKLQLKHDIFKNNVNIGLQTIEQHKMDVCVCHGVSASCTLKTCWKIINRNFSMIANSLKVKYNSALLIKPDILNKLEDTEGKLMFLAQSPNFCNMTRGRRCKEHNHCATLCCGRGYDEASVMVNEQCQCKWNGLVLSCEICKMNRTHFICK